MTELQLMSPHGAVTTSYGNCRCGCGGKTSIAKKTRNDLGHVKGEPVPFLRGHRVCAHKVFQVSEGRTSVRMRFGRYYLWSRLLMWNEIGRELNSEEIVHHINGDCGDDRVSNYQIVTRAEHLLLHRAEFEVERLVALRDASPGRVAKECHYCGKSIAVRPSTLRERNYCSRQCAGLDRRTHIVAHCEVCKERFERPAAAFRGSHVYCSPTCATKGRVAGMRAAT